MGAMGLTEPAQADEYWAITPSGNTEAIYDLSIEETSALLANACMDMNWPVMETTSTTVVCESPLSFGQRLLGALFSPQYSTPTKRYFRFNVAKLMDASRAQANAWTETQSAFGQTQRSELGGEKYHNDVTYFFEVTGARLPPGTTFPNHAWMGAQYQYVEDPDEGMQILGLVEDGPFARAGVQVGDIVQRIAREKQKNQGDLLDGLHRAAKDATYEIELRRDGKKMKLEVEREYRATIVGPPPPSAADIAAVEGDERAAQGPGGLQGGSVADELAKFAKLRDDGIITADEFEVQKARLLGMPEPSREDASGSAAAVEVDVAAAAGNDAAAEGDINAEVAD
jgi:hypothetical protein